MAASTDTGSRKASDGFTLIELIIAIILIGLLAAVGTTMISDSFDTTRMVDSSQSFAARVRYTMERLEREIREGKTITAKSTSGMTFTKGNGTSVTIASSSGGITIDGALLIDASPALPLFTYWKNDSTTAADAVDHSDVRFVEINLTVRDDPVNGSGQTISQRSRIALRNET